VNANRTAWINANNQEIFTISFNRNPMVLIISWFSSIVVLFYAFCLINGPEC